MFVVVVVLGDVVEGWSERGGKIREEGEGGRGDCTLWRF